ncbi:MAG: alkaline phosphatase family protein, partial [Alphaproteobacteria bacterium]|nr:alkaline phosphatase family protein [Alphaproteobacteria bacterium]
PPARVAWVGIDGAAWENLQPLIDRGVLPHLARLQREGVTGPLTIDSAQSPESWTSIATGHHPPEHGIIQTPGVEGSTFAATAQQLKVKRVWDMAGERERKVMVANYWVTGKVYPVNGVMIGRESDEVYPPGLLSQQADLQPEAYPERIRELSLGAAKSGWMRAALERVPDFDFIVLPIYAYDQSLHMLWDEWEAGEALAGEAPPAALSALPEDERARIAEGHGVVVEAAKLADQLVGQAFDYVGEDGYVLLFSDHGHRAADPSMRRIALSRALFDGRAGTVEQGQFQVEGATVTLSPVERRVRGATQALSYTLRLPELRFEGEGAEAARERFLALTEPDGEPLFVAQGGALVPGPVALRASASALGKLDTAHYSVFVNSGAHGIEDKGLFGLWGPEVAAGALSQEIESVDITPTTLWLLGLPTADDLAGEPATFTLTEAGQAARPVRHVSSYEDGSRPWARPVSEGLSVEEIERLKALGYLKGEAEGGPPPPPGEPGQPRAPGERVPPEGGPRGPANPPPKRMPPGEPPKGPASPPPR